MQKLTVRKEIRLTTIQSDSLTKLAKYGVNVNEFIRIAIKEKIRRDWPSIKEKQTKTTCPF